MSQAYVGATKRTFQQALIHLLEGDYGLLGSRRILETLAEDVQKLADQFYPAPHHLSSGWMVFTGTRASGGKTHPGQSAGEHELVTLAWPVLLPEDVEYLAHHSDAASVRQEWFRSRLVRLIEHGLQHPDGAVLLTLADLAAMLGLSTVQVSQLLAGARRLTGKPLPTKGYFFDQGMRPTHKEEVVALYEAGLDEAAIARQTQHAPESVGHYLRDYERVKLLLSHHTPLAQVGLLIDMQPGVIQAYAKMVSKYHPEISWS
ncbi:MAG: DUF1670 domain-containing protein [Chloroflexota bacterium]